MDTKAWFILIIGASILAHNLTDNIYRAIGISVGVCFVAVAVATNGMEPPLDKKK